MDEVPAGGVGVDGGLPVLAEGPLVEVAAPVGVHQDDGVGPGAVVGVPLEYRAELGELLLPEVPLGRPRLEPLVGEVLVVPLEEGDELLHEPVPLAAPPALLQDAVEAALARRHLVEGLLHQRVAQGQAAGPEVGDRAGDAVLGGAVAVVPQAPRRLEVDGDEVEGAVLEAAAGHAVHVVLGVLVAAHEVRHQRAAGARVGQRGRAHHVEQHRQPAAARRVHRQPGATLAARLAVTAPDHAAPLLPAVGVVGGPAVVLVPVGGEHQAEAVRAGVVAQLQEEHAHGGGGGDNKGVPRTPRERYPSREIRGESRRTATPRSRADRTADKEKRRGTASRVERCASGSRDAPRRDASVNNGERSGK